MKYDILVFIGRFQPFHDGHKRVLNRALELSDKVLVLIGSSNLARSLRNPFTYSERRSMIKSVYPTDRVRTAPLNDITYNDVEWLEQVQRLITQEVLLSIPGNSKTVTISGLNDVKVGLIGCNKDNTSYYLNLFPTFGSENVDFLNPISATDLRNIYFKNENKSEALYFNKSIPYTVFKFLCNFRCTTEYKKLKEEFEYIKQYKESVQKYPRIEHTVDAVVIQSGHILLIRRRAEPGKGMWALPGGFIHIEETLEDAMLRELREEAKLKVPEPVLRGSIVKSKTYDNPNRSARGRIITNAYYIKLADMKELPKVKGSDDADKAKWIPLADLSCNELFEDHYFIIKDMV